MRVVQLDLADLLCQASLLHTHCTSKAHTSCTAACTRSSPTLSLPHAIPTSISGLVGEIIKRFEQKGFKLAAMKMQVCSKDHMEEHYKDLAGKGFFAGLVEYMTSGPVVCMVWAGKGVVATGRKMLGATNPADSAPGTIRGDFCVEVGRNICHGSDAVESAEREIALWFPEGVCDWTSSEEAWVYE